MRKRDENPRKPDTYRIECFECGEARNEKDRKPRARPNLWGLNHLDDVDPNNAIIQDLHSQNETRLIHVRKRHGHPKWRSYPVQFLGYPQSRNETEQESSASPEVQDLNRLHADREHASFSPLGSFSCPSNALSILEPVRQQVSHIVKRGLESKGINTQTLTMPPVA